MRVKKDNTNRAFLLDYWRLVMNSAISLEYTVPFVKDHNAYGKTILIDKIEVPSVGVISKELFNLVSEKINVSEYGDSVPTEIAIDLIDNQYNVCLNYIFSHNIWEVLRSGAGRNILLAYIIENRHYLCAATSRMSSGVAYSSHIHPYTFILSEHLLEEEDHNVFFEKALEILGVSRDVLEVTRPSPQTIEWIQLMRAISARHPVVSAICSGLMESSAKNRDAVKGWHEMLISSGIIETKAIESFYAHVELDIKLGHGDCWKSVLETQQRINTDLLCESLNAVTLVAEQLYRWFGSLESGLSGIYVSIAKNIHNIRDRSEIYAGFDQIFDGSPIFSSRILEFVSYGKDELTESVAEVVSLSYFLNPRVHEYDIIDESDKLSAAKKLSQSTCSPVIAVSRGVNLKEQLLSWMKCIEGHSLWKSMLGNPSHDLIGGYIVENYHYLRSSVSHSMSAIYSCTNSKVRTMLVKHLREEEKHCDLLGSSLAGNGIDYQSLRPLATTVSFIGYLKELAITDWIAYSIALSFLQLSIETNSNKHSSFYAQITEGNPTIGTLIQSMQQHDSIDEYLGHVADIEELLSALECYEIPQSSINRAALVCTHTWSFLDGIEKYYSFVNTLNSRIGWNAGNGVWI